MTITVTEDTTTVPGFKILTFSTDIVGGAGQDVTTYTFLSSTIARIFLVGAGGGGSATGGGGGYTEEYIDVDISGEQFISVGIGGNGGGASGMQEGGYSRIGSDATYQAAGGKPGTWSSSTKGGDGGSGGGTMVVSGTGYNGGTNGGNGGGSYGGTGQGTTTETDITGSTTRFGGGGGGGGETGGTGGLGGGGNGAVNTGENGDPDTGGGGGGARNTSGGIGGSGIVIVRFPIPQTASTSIQTIFGSANAMVI